MKRRVFLGTVGVAGLATTAGCLSGEDSPSNMVLSQQDDIPGDPEDFSYPAYGQSVPSVEVPDPIADETIDISTLDRTAVLTTFFAECPAECGILINNLAGVQALLDERGQTDDVRFLAITFDPERDDADRLRENAQTNGVSLDAGNWHYLRPASDDEAESVVRDTLGIPFQRVDESDRMAGYDFDHMVITLLVNPGGVVERVYRGENFDREQFASDVETVIDEYDPDEHT